VEKAFGALLDFWPLTALLALAVLWYGWKRLRVSLRLFVMMAAGSVAGFLVAVFLHNAVYALSARWWGPPGLEEPVFFIMAVILCPVLLAVGVVGSAVVALRSRSVQH